MEETRCKAGYGFGGHLRTCLQTDEVVKGMQGWKEKMQVKSFFFVTCNANLRYGKTIYSTH